MRYEYQKFGGNNHQEVAEFLGDDFLTVLLDDGNIAVIPTYSPGYQIKPGDVVHK